MIRGLHLLVGVIVFQKPTLLLLIDILVITMGVKSRWHSVITDKHPTTVFLNSSLSWRTMEIIQALCLFVCDVMMFGTIISNTTDMHIFFLILIIFVYFFHFVCSMLLLINVFQNVFSLASNLYCINLVLLSNVLFYVHKSVQIKHNLLTL